MKGLICGLGSVWLMEYRYEGVNLWIGLGVADGIQV